MKRVIFFAGFLLAIFSSGCKKENLKSSDTYMSAYKNGTKFWKSDNSGGILSKVNKSISIYGHNNESLVIELNVNDFSNLQSSSIKEARFTTFIGGDVVSDEYSLDSNNNKNQVTITEIDETKQLIRGRFNIYLIRSAWFSPNGEKISFTSGKFVVKYINN